MPIFRTEMGAYVPSSSTTPPISTSGTSSGLLGQLLPQPCRMPADESLSVLVPRSRAWYTMPDSTRTVCIIVKVHHDDSPPYYTINLEHGQERSTLRSRLRAFQSPSATSPGCSEFGDIRTTTRSSTPDAADSHDAWQQAAYAAIPQSKVAALESLAQAFSPQCGAFWLARLLRKEQSHAEQPRSTPPPRPPAPLPPPPFVFRSAVSYPPGLGYPSAPPAATTATAGATTTDDTATATTAAIPATARAATTTAGSATTTDASATATTAARKARGRGSGTLVAAGGCTRGV